MTMLSWAMWCRRNRSAQSYVTAMISGSTLSSGYIWARRAEEFGVASKNIASFTDSKDPNVRRFLGAEGGLGTMLGLSDDFMTRVIRLVGNYGELFERHLQPLNLARGVNNLWTQGGLLYTPPFR